jgi:hypothetical protein
MRVIDLWIECSTPYPWQNKRLKRSFLIGHHGHGQFQELQFTLLVGQQQQQQYSCQHMTKFIGIKKAQRYLI